MNESSPQWPRLIYDSIYAWYYRKRTQEQRVSSKISLRDSYILYIGIYRVASTFQDYLDKAVIA